MDSGDCRVAIPVAECPRSRKTGHGLRPYKIASLFQAALIAPSTSAPSCHREPDGLTSLDLEYGMRVSTFKAVAAAAWRAQSAKRSRQKSGRPR